jgi:hypothetical protein
MQTTAHLRFLVSNLLKTRGIFLDNVCNVHDEFVEDLESDWKNSTQFMVAIGKCKKIAVQSDSARSRYGTGRQIIHAFWATLFVGQRGLHHQPFEAWLPSIPKTWIPTRPPLTVVHPGHLELAENTLIIKRAVVARSGLRDGEFTERVESPHVTAVDLEHPGWSTVERAIHRAAFVKLGSSWVDGPYDIYHRPFELPAVVPDSYWECRRLLDKKAHKHNDARSESILSGLSSDTREQRRQFRQLVNVEIYKQPPMVPLGLLDTSVAKSALGRRFFITKDGYSGLGPRGTRNGDCVAVLMGCPVPFVLQKDESDTFRVIGETYVHGIMNGEAIKECQLRNMEISDIKLC